MTLMFSQAEGPLPVSIPRAARLPSDLAALEAAQPTVQSLLALGRLEHQAQAERTAFIGQLIASSLREAASR